MLLDEVMQLAYGTGVSTSFNHFVRPAGSGIYSSHGTNFDVRRRIDEIPIT
jgi:hypothetical protein